MVELKMRINKFVAECGVASRRNADILISEGKVKVNGKIAVTGMEIDVQNDSVTVDGHKIKPVNNFTYIMFNKPKGCVATVSDEKDRKTIFDYIDLKERLFPVGRLDYDSEGLLLVTNDGDFAYRLTHPSNEVPKTYLVKIEGDLEESKLALLRKGVELDGVKTHRAKIKLKKFENGITEYEMTIYEGKNRQIRRMFETVGANVIFLKRIAVGDVRLGGLARSKYRFLTNSEVEYLKNI